MGKWDKFRSDYSTVNVLTEPFHDPKINLLGDWQREAKVERMSINGVPLKTIIETHPDFPSGLKETEDVERFFKDVILSGMKTTNNSTKDDIASYLKTRFYQGGFMNPLSSSLAFAIKDNSKESAFPFASIDSEQEQGRHVNIITTEKGFKIDEIVTVQSISITQEELFKPFEVTSNNPRVSPEKPAEKNYIFRAQSILDIDFSQNPISPSVKVEKNTIDYGHSLVKEKMNYLNPLEKIIAFLVKMFGRDKVKDVSQMTVEPKNSENQEKNISPK